MNRSLDPYIGLSGDPLDAVIDESGTKTSTDAAVVGAVRSTQTLLNRIKPTPVTGQLSDEFLTTLSSALGKSIEATAQMTWRQVQAALSSKAPAGGGMSLEKKLYIGAGIAAVLMIWKMR